MNQTLNDIQPWFVPHFDPRDYNPRERVMLEVWKNHMSHEDEHSIGWCTRLEALLSDIPRARTVRGGRMATTVAVWLMTNVGRSILEEVLCATTAESFLLEKDVVAIWAAHNKLSPSIRNYLEHLVRSSDGKPVYEDPPYPTMEDNRVVEHVLIYLAGVSGRTLLKEVCEKANEPKLFSL